VALVVVQVLAQAEEQEEQEEQVKDQEEWEVECIECQEQEYSIRLPAIDESVLQQPVIHYEQLDSGYLHTNETYQQTWPYHSKLKRTTIVG
jgi:hypothetical protein